MKRVSNLVVIIYATMILSSCATSLSSSGSQVRTISSGDNVEACDFLGVVTAKSPAFALTPGQEAEYVMNDARNKVAERGGTHMRMLNDNHGIFTGATINAEAYRCPLPQR